MNNRRGRRARNNQSTCAVCKYRKQTCTADCDMAPFFPASRSDELEAAGKIFGVSKIIDNIRAVPPHLKRDAAESILEEGKARARDPAGGSYAIVMNLMNQIALAEKELQATKEQVAYHREIAKQRTTGGGSSSSMPPRSANMEDEIKKVDGMLNFQPTSPAGTTSSSRSGTNGGKTGSSRKGKKPMKK